MRASAVTSIHILFLAAACLAPTRGAAPPQATIPANGSLSVWLRVGAESAAHGSHEASVHVAWANGTEDVPAPRANLCFGIC